jgi:carbon-monoxide dehydrogenase medium subunit/2-furoyl-CoA dehydrogenase FAD binding subunit
MKAASFDYVRADSIEQACALLAQHGSDAKLIAGGQSLVPMMAMRLARPAVLIDVNHVEALRTWSIAGDVLRLGACVGQNVIEREAAIAAAVPLLRQAIRWVGHNQTRNRGTVGGSIAHADPSAELPLVACALDARLLVRSHRGERSIAASLFFTGPMSTALEPDELLVEIEFPVWRESRVGAAFDELAIRHGDFAIVAAAAQVALDDQGRCVRAALGIGGADAAVRAYPDLAARLVGQTLSEPVVRDVAAEVSRRVQPSSDLHASAAYRRHLAEVLTGRVLRAAFNVAVTSTRSSAASTAAGAASTAVGAASTAVGAASTAVGAASTAASPRSTRPDPRIARSAGAALASAPALAPAAMARVDADSRSADRLHTVSLDVNGKRCSAQVTARTTLVDLLRDELRLTGTHVGCEHGICGACTVLLDGEPVRSCLAFAVQVDGQRVMTVEGLANPDGSLSVLQDSFCEAHGLQCGYCTPGMLLAAHALLVNDPRPTEHAIREAISGNLCRCTGYQQIVDAIQLAARRQHA